MITKKRSERRKHCARAGRSKVRTPPTRCIHQSHRQDRLQWHTTQCGAGRICGADLNGDNLRSSTAYLRISDHCRVTVRVANFCIQTAGEGDKMRINHVIKTDQWRCDLQIRPAPHFVVFRLHYTAPQLASAQCN